MVLQCVFCISNIDYAFICYTFLKCFILIYMISCSFSIGCSCISHFTWWNISFFRQSLFSLSISKASSYLCSIVCACLKCAELGGVRSVKWLGLRHPPQCEERHPLPQILHLQECNIMLTHWGRGKMAAIFQTIFSNPLFLMKMYEFRFKFHWSLLPGVQLTILKHWFR